MPVLEVKPSTAKMFQDWLLEKYPEDPVLKSHPVGLTRNQDLTQDERSRYLEVMVRLESPDKNLIARFLEFRRIEYPDAPKS